MLRLMTVTFSGRCRILVVLRRAVWVAMFQVIFKTRVSTQGILISIVNEGHLPVASCLCGSSGETRPSEDPPWLQRCRQIPLVVAGGVGGRTCAAGETRVAFEDAGTCCEKPSAVTRLLGPQVSHWGQGNTVVTLGTCRLHSLACGMAAGSVRVMHWEPGPRA